MVWRLLFQIALIASAMGYTSAAMANTKGQSIVDCALANSPNEYEAELYRALRAALLYDKELAIDREKMLSFFANCEDFPKLGGDDRLLIGFAYFGAVLEAGAAPRLRSAGIDLAELDNALAPLGKGYSILELFDPSSKRPAVFADNLEKRLQAFFGDQHEAVRAKSEDALILYAISLVGRQAVAQDT